MGTEDVVDRYPSLQPIYGEANTEYRAMLALVSACDTSIADFIIVLEEDFAVSSSMTASDVYAQLSNGVWLLEHGVHAVRMRHRKDWGSGGDPERSWRNFLRGGAIGGGSLLSHVLWDNAAEIHVPEIAVCRAVPTTLGLRSYMTFARLVGQCTRDTRARNSRVKMYA